MIGYSARNRPDTHPDSALLHASLNAVWGVLLCSLLLSCGQMVQADGSPVEPRQQLDQPQSVTEEPSAGPEEDKPAKIKKTKPDKSKQAEFKVSGYTQLRYERSEKANGSTERDYGAERARVKLTATSGGVKTAMQVDVAENVAEWKGAYIAYELGQKREFAIGLVEWPFGYEVTNSSSNREAPERALVFKRLFPGQRDRGATVGGKIKDTKWIVGLFDGSGSGEVNERIRDANGDVIAEVSKTITSDYNSRKDVVGSILWKRGNAEMGISGYIGRGIWDSKRRRLLDETKDRYGTEFRYFGDQWTLKAEYVRGRGVDESDKDFDNSDWISGYYLQVGRFLGGESELVARYSSISQDPEDPDYGRRSAWDIGWLKWLNSRTRARLFYQINGESEESVDNNALIAEWMLTY